MKETLITTINKEYTEFFNKEFYPNRVELFNNSFYREEDRPVQAFFALAVFIHSYKNELEQNPNSLLYKKQNLLIDCLNNTLNQKEKQLFNQEWFSTDCFSKEEQSGLINQVRLIMNEQEGLSNYYNRFYDDNTVDWFSIIEEATELLNELLTMDYYNNLRMGSQAALIEEKNVIKELVQLQFSSGAVELTVNNPVQKTLFEAINQALIEKDYEQKLVWLLAWANYTAIISDTAWDGFVTIIKGFSDECIKELQELIGLSLFFIKENRLFGDELDSVYQTAFDQRYDELLEL